MNLLMRRKAGLDQTSVSVNFNFAIFHFPYIGHSLSVDACALVPCYSPKLESMTREAVMAPVRECLREAAILKKKAGKKQQKQSDDDESSQVDEVKSDAVINSTRETLLNSFRHLRPVTSKDFGDGIAFFLGEQPQNMPLSHIIRHAHYDSSSSEDEEEKEDDEEQS